PDLHPSSCFHGRCRVHVASMTDAASLTLDRLHKQYGNITALLDVSLTLNAGDVTALLGPSGAGKSTLLRLIAGLEYPTSGSILANDAPLSTPKKITPPEKRGIGLVFQDFALFPNMTAAQNVSFSLKALSKPEKASAALEWLETLGIAHRADAYPHQLSGGEQQRVAIARTIAAKPKAIMMDEPFSGLDPENREAVRSAALNAIRAANIPTLLVTHDPEEALAHADKIAILERGVLLQTGTPDALYTRPNSKTVASAFGILNTVQADALPKAWKGILPHTEGKLYYRPEAFEISASDISQNAMATAINRIGAAHKISAKLETGAQISFTTVLTAPPKPSTTITITPRPHLFYAF
ncbi:MAG: ABC transporter ATP-binding protein, partial [Pseudomonadota bacterium]